MTRTEPEQKRVVAFIDGQNLYRSVKDAYGYSHPNFDIRALVGAVCTPKAWNINQIRFYTGVPEKYDNAHWHHFWQKKLRAMAAQGIVTYKRYLRHGREKGIDVRIAIDLIRMAHKKAYDVGLIFSQDQDLSEVADEIKTISIEQDRWIKTASAYPNGGPNKRGINMTEWVPFEKAVYDGCIDPRDYRPKR